VDDKDKFDLFDEDEHDDLSTTVDLQIFTFLFSYLDRTNS
jgi:hypothetical protein